MCLWNWTAFSGLWWVFPLMFIVCMVVMFLIACGPARRMMAGNRCDRFYKESGGRKGSYGGEDGHERDH